MPPKEHFERYLKALTAFDEENSKDPNRETVDGEEIPRELLYAERLSDWVLRLNPEASEALCLASRCQHLCRWMIPRESHELTKAGYLKWRAELKRFHALKSGETLWKAGYDEKMVEAVRALNLKTNFPDDPESRTLEDALCLVFLQFQLKALAEKTAPEKVVNALRKSWKKMTPAARREAMSLNFSPLEMSLLEQALDEDKPGVAPVNAPDFLAPSSAAAYP